MSEPIKCPKCGNDCEADFVDIGVGEQRASPWGCPNCHWVEETEDLINDGFDNDGELF
jgi:hypothetical protein